jgi:hypothetical protein
MSAGPGATADVAPSCKSINCSACRHVAQGCCPAAGRLRNGSHESLRLKIRCAYAVPFVNRLTN